MFLNASQGTLDRQSVPISDAGETIARFDVLDSWRGIAAIMVVLFHCQVVGNLYTAHLVRAGEMFVDFFFVLSGFVIAHAYAERISSGRQYGKFMLLRFGRVYPLHLVMLALFILFEIGKAFVPGLTNPQDPAFSGTNEISSIFTNLLLVQGLGIHSGLTWNTPAWSISAEFFAYILFGLAVLASRRYLPILAAFTAALCFWALATLAPNGMESTFDFGAIRALYGFSLGVALHQLAIRPIMSARHTLRNAAWDSSARLAWTFAELAAVWCVLTVVTTTYESPLALAAPLIFTFAIHVFAHEGGHISSLLKTRVFLAVGTLSYSIYMIHMFVALRFINVARLTDKVFDTVLVVDIHGMGKYSIGIDPGNALVGDLIVVAIVLTTIGLSYAAYRLIEQPGRNYFRRLADRVFG